MNDSIRIGIAKIIESGSRCPSNLSQGPEVMESGGLDKLLNNLGCELIESETAKLTPDEENEYGAWHRLGLANRHLRDIVANQKRNNIFTLGLLSNCNALMGMLAGLQHGGPTKRPQRVGLVWIDAHGDFNTPDTSLSGMLGGMPVAISTGLCLPRLRMKCGLDPPLPPRYITMVSVRDLDPLEQELLDRTEIQHITTKHIRDLSPVIDLEIERLATFTDTIYVHIDMDALDPSEVQGHDLTVPDGPTSQEMAEALELMFEHPSAGAFGVASYPAGEDPDRRTLRAVYNMIEGVIKGIKNRDF